MVDRNHYCVIMAGGIGSRFWPLSRTSRPKQFLDILGIGKSLLQQTFDRMVKLAPPENILVVTSSAYRDLVLEQLPAISPNQVLLEPMRRNTAPCIAYAAYRILAKNPNALITVAPSDHLILNEQVFLDTVRDALHFADESNALITLGIKPSRPETGYGYIQVDSPVKDYSNLFKVKTFTEKPDLKLAKVFIESGEFYWNSGLFIWKLPAILNAFERYLPEVNALFKECYSDMGTEHESRSIERVYSECRNVSIDYGIMEKADNVYVICSEFGWSDLGTWGSLALQLPKDETGSAVVGDVLLYQSTDLMVNIPDRKLAVIRGLTDFIVVDTDDVLLICPKKDEQHIKDFVNDITLNKNGRYI